MKINGTQDSLTILTHSRTIHKYNTIQYLYSFSTTSTSSSSSLSSYFPVPFFCTSMSPRPGYYCAHMACANIQNHLRLHRTALESFARHDASQNARCHQGSFETRFAVRKHFAYQPACWQNLQNLFDSKH